MGFPCGSAGKESARNVGDLGSIPGLGRSPVEGKGSPLQYSGLENSTDCVVHGVAKSWTRLSHFHFHRSPVDTHPSVLPDTDKHPCCVLIISAPSSAGPDLLSFPGAAA